MGPVWPDLAKFRHFCNILKPVNNFVFLFGLFGTWKNFEPTLAILWCYLMHFLLSSKVKYWINNLAIWSHWLWPKYCVIPNAILFAAINASLAAAKIIWQKNRQSISLPNFFPLVTLLRLFWHFTVSNCRVIHSRDGETLIYYSFKVKSITIKQKLHDMITQLDVWKRFQTDLI